MPNDNNLNPGVFAAYFKQLAASHVEILHSENEQHFFRAEMDEVENALFSKMNYPAFIYESSSFEMRDLKSDNAFKERYHAFMILNKVPDITDYENVHQEMDDMEMIADDFIAKIKQDKRQPNKPIRNINLDTISGTRITFETACLAGIRITFQLEQTFPADVNNEHWISNSD